MRITYGHVLFDFIVCWPLLLSRWFDLLRGFLSEGWIIHLSGWLAMVDDTCRLGPCLLNPFNRVELIPDPYMRSCMLYFSRNVSKILCLKLSQLLWILCYVPVVGNIENQGRDSPWLHDLGRKISNFIKLARLLSVEGGRLRTCIWCGQTASRASLGVDTWCAWGV